MKELVAFLTLLATNGVAQYLAQTSVDSTIASLTVQIVGAVVSGLLTMVIVFMGKHKEIFGAFFSVIEALEINGPNMTNEEKRAKAIQEIDSELARRGVGFVYRRLIGMVAGHLIDGLAKWVKGLIRRG